MQETDLPATNAFKGKQRQKTATCLPPVCTCAHAHVETYGTCADPPPSQSSQFLRFPPRRSHFGLCLSAACVNIENIALYWNGFESQITP